MKKRKQNAAHYEAAAASILQAVRDRYDADPIYRIEKLIGNARRDRRRRLARRREALSG